MKIAAHGATDLGRKRTVNEDNYKICPKFKLYMVADGMGGHIAGEIASHLAVDIITEAVQQQLFSGNETDRDEIHPGRLLENSIQLANTRILETANKRRELEGMGTTIAAVIARGNTLHMANVGDSRIYRIRNDEIHLLTFDHSWVNMQVRLGNITEEEARYHPMKNVITRALGTQRMVEVDIMAHLMRDDDLVVLCTDGLSNYVQPEEIASNVLENPANLEKCTEKLIQIANSRGGEDNITVVILRFLEIESEDINEEVCCVDGQDQDTEIIPKQQIQDRFDNRRLPRHPR